MVPAGGDTLDWRVDDHRVGAVGRSPPAAAGGVAGADEARARGPAPGDLADPAGGAVHRRPALGRHLDCRPPELPGRPLRRHAGADRDQLSPGRHDAGESPVPGDPERSAVARAVRGNRPRVPRDGGRRALPGTGIPGPQLSARLRRIDSRQDRRQPALHGGPGALSPRHRRDRAGERGLDRGPRRVGRAEGSARVGARDDRAQDRAGRRAGSAAAACGQRAGKRVRFGDRRGSAQDGSRGSRGPARDAGARARVRQPRRRAGVSRRHPDAQVPLRPRPLSERAVRVAAADPPGHARQGDRRGADGALRQGRAVDRAAARGAVRDRAGFRRERAVLLHRRAARGRAVRLPRGALARRARARRAGDPA